MLLLVASIALICIGTWILTGVLRRYALAKQLIDMPNQRSSHIAPTPRGGGVAIVVAVLVSFVSIGFVYPELAKISWALSCGPLLVAVIGFWDDHGHIPATWRLVAHFLAAAIGLVFVGGLPALSIFDYQLELGIIGAAGAAIYVVWLLNLYNFMDGIDGIASIEAITVGLGGALLFFLVVPDSGAWLFPFFLASSVLGFLVWNFPPARIFMGDAGSGFIGSVMGMFTVVAAGFSDQLIWCWLILLGVFVVDATTTLLRRFIRGEPVYEAHRSHAYQYASRLYAAHLPVSVGVGLINVVFLLPVSILVGVGILEGIIGVLITYIPLYLLVLHFKAGAAELQDL
ncbi:MAG: glycosyltransferase family 4 protein [Bacteroidetes bacterium]|nr:MAG: glycosyltransferase family 4 protein [Bacteroidota bacterium]